MRRKKPNKPEPYPNALLMRQVCWLHFPGAVLFLDCEERSITISRMPKHILYGHCWLLQLPSMSESRAKLVQLQNVGQLIQFHQADTKGGETSMVGSGTEVGEEGGRAQESSSRTFY